MSKFTNVARRVGHGVTHTDLSDVGQGVVRGASAVTHNTVLAARSTKDVASGFVEGVREGRKDELQLAFEAHVSFDKSDDTSPAREACLRYMRAMKSAVDEAQGSARKLRKLQKRVEGFQVIIQARLTEEEIAQVNAIERMARLGALDFDDVFTGLSNLLQNA